MDKIELMESLIGTLATVFNMSTNQVAQRLLAFSIRSYEQFKEAVEQE